MESRSMVDEPISLRARRASTSFEGWPTRQCGTQKSLIAGNAALWRILLHPLSAQGKSTADSKTMLEGKQSR
jgi:hypothetical protein